MVIGGRMYAAFVEIVLTAFLVAAIFAFIDERNSFAPPKTLFTLQKEMEVKKKSPLIRKLNNAK